MSRRLTAGALGLVRVPGPQLVSTHLRVQVPIFWNVPESA